MKRDPDLIRRILLAIEAAPRGEMVRLSKLPGYDRRTVHYHVHLAIERDLVRTIEQHRRPDQDWLFLRLTWAGYDFLDLIRDEKVWRLTKAGAKKVGSWSFDTIGALTKAVIMSKAALLGIPLA